ncbi:MAG: indole-3-glycerol phosphate synthase TrpC [Clostridiaceae bacterium]|jgi:indole-3-glycerol phosphate synthase|nr:indole-3-glycerol phosphate synthase TrpC [Clostridiaceae bacterium]
MILDTLVKSTLRRVAAEKEILSVRDAENAARALHAEYLSTHAKPEFPFERALKKPGVAFICEIKKASPSKGVICEAFPYLDIAKAYESAGADAVSVLTEPEFFKGDKAYLKEISEAVTLPLLRKDFITDTYQVYQSRLLGASAVLLICSVLDDALLKECLKIAHSLGLSALVEAHDEDEVKRALTAGAKIIGVNNRDLKTFKVDLSVSLRLRKLVPPEVLFVSESGISTRGDIERLAENGTDAVLIGEALMRAEDKTAYLHNLKNGV